MAGAAVASDNPAPARPPPALPPRRYLGDAVSVEFDGFQFWLICSDPPCRIALEPGVLAGFHHYLTDVLAWLADLALHDPRRS